MFSQALKSALFFQKKKTAEERERRLQKLVQETNDKIKSQLVFHLQHSFAELELSKLTNREQVEALIKQVEYTVDGSFFSEAVVAGPFDRNYVYTLTKERTNTVVRSLRSKAAAVLEQGLTGMQHYWDTKKKSLPNN